MLFWKDVLLILGLLFIMKGALAAYEVLRDVYEKTKRDLQALIPLE